VLLTLNAKSPAQRRGS